ncbi:MULTISPECIES: hypothetical protein [unclassified Rhodococcus (in: high G+C Gram-positive bacteria)]|uniref:hypothetical protein n=1 Tax=unclassified Rhodococcus (in: high G+C Gram-positive bacteria) TaxID=192944 RepID=UPI00215BD6FE|nr:MULTISPECIES: hypothetical protein [unclassified Rhodococcus (in: high G+C Gram-positive bacteria)]
MSAPLREQRKSLEAIASTLGVGRSSVGRALLTAIQQIYFLVTNRGVDDGGVCTAVLLFFVLVIRSLVFVNEASGFGVCLAVWFRVGGEELIFGGGVIVDGAVGAGAGAGGLGDQVEVAAAMEVCVGLGQEVLCGGGGLRTRCGSLKSGTGRLVIGSGVLERSDGGVMPVAAIIFSGSVVHTVALVCISSTLPL